MKEFVKISPSNIPDVIVEFSDSFELDKNVLVSVPSSYVGIIIINDKPCGRLETCNNESLYKYLGKEYLKDRIVISYIKKANLPAIPWGFGEIPVKNEKLAETYRVGANGKYYLTIKDPALLVKAFGTEKNITLDDISSKTKMLIKTVGKPILSKFFADTMVSVFEITSKSDEIRSLIYEAVSKEKLLKECGLELKELTVEGIHVPDEDMELIRKVINQIDD